MLCKSAVGVILLLLSLCGCTYTVHPLLEKNDLVRDVDLSGTWEVEFAGRDGKTQPRRIELSPFNDGASYDVFFKSWDRKNADKEHYVLDVGRIKDRMYVQFKAIELPEDGPPFLDAIPVYGFARIEPRAGEIHVFQPNDGWCERSVNPEDAPNLHYDITGGIGGTGKPFVIFTLATDRLQEFVHSKGKNIFFDKPMIWRRVESKARENKPTSKAEPSSSRKDQQKPAAAEREVQ